VESAKAKTDEINDGGNGKGKAVPLVPEAHASKEAAASELGGAILGTRQGIAQDRTCIEEHKPSDQTSTT
jgi:hypothetical protein